MFKLEELDTQASAVDDLILESSIAQMTSTSDVATLQELVRTTMLSAHHVSRTRLREFMDAILQAAQKPTVDDPHILASMHRNAVYIEKFLGEKAAA